MLFQIFYSALIEYGRDKNIKVFSELKFELDYVEKISGFRNFLHHFTEIANDKEPVTWKVPYHHGTFEEFEQITFDLIRYQWDLDDYGRFITKTVKVKHRYDMVIFSNFLTSVDQVKKLQNELQNCMRYIRNIRSVDCCRRNWRPISKCLWRY